MPLIRKHYTVSQSNDPSTEYHKFVDLSVELSEYYGKMIRQGHSFKLRGVNATLYPHQDYDTGLTAQIQCEYSPVMKHSRNAWNALFNQWKAQKKLRTPRISSDDFELGWSIDQTMYSAGRTSKIFTQGIGDTTEEFVCIYGSANDGTDITLYDYYNSVNQAPVVSKDPFNNASAKPNKFGSALYPLPESFLVTAATSSVTTATGAMLSGALSDQGQTNWSPINILAGLLHLKIKISPDDTVAQAEDDMTLVVEFDVQSWKPLVYPKSKKSKKPFTRRFRKTRGKSRGRRRR